MVKQGEVLNVYGINFPVLVMSSDEYNVSGKVIVCPLKKEKEKSIFSREINIPSFAGYVCLDDVKKISLKSREHNSRGQISLMDIILFSGILQSVFEYV